MQAHRDLKKPPPHGSDPLHSLFQQLTSMTNTQQQQTPMHPNSKAEPNSPWGFPQTGPSGHPSQQNNGQGPVPWMTPNTNTPWDFREHMNKQMVRSMIIRFERHLAIAINDFDSSS